MFIDGRDVPSGATIEADVCIVGTGPASAAIARVLADERAELVLLESGDRTREIEPQLLCQGVAGNGGFSPFHVRNRQFGGTANLWTMKAGPHDTLCRFAPFDAIDFERRDWLPYSGWPFGKDELDPYYRRACAVCGLGPYAFDGATWERPDSRQLPFPDGRLRTTVFQFGAREHITQTYSELVTGSEAVKCYLNSTAVELHTDDAGGTVRGIEVVTSGENRFRVKADRYVLAAGGIENPRLLLQSNSTLPRGLGNQHDLVGRFFMDHYMVHSGYLFPFDKGAFDRAVLYDLRVVDGTVVQGKLSFTKEAMQEERLLNAATYLLPRYLTEHLRTWGLDSFRTLRQSIRCGRMPREASRHLKSLAKLSLHAGFAAYRRMIRRRLQYPWIAAGGWSDLPDKPTEFASFEIQHLVEQCPHPDNRVTLSDERDRFGYRRPRIDCILREPDLASLRRIQELLAEEFLRSGLGRMVLTPGHFPRISSPDGSGHHMGTTRMHPDPKQGVVDVDCKVHGVSNLYVAGSSVFPTGSYANPTLTIIAMAIRLADHLKAVPGPSMIG